MASTDAEAAALPVDEIAAMSDAELGQFMKKHRRPDGGYDLPVDGWDKLSKDERNRLAERLKARERDLAQSPAACSRPLDLDDLDARLRQVSSDNSSSLRREPRSVERSEPPTPPFDREDWTTRYEIECYHKLVNDGGRPLYPIDLIKDVFFRNTDNYSEMLRPWQEHPEETRPEGTFPRQLRRWQDFRKWQDDNRGREDDDGSFPAYVEREKNRIQQDFKEMVEWLKYVEPRESRKEAVAVRKEAVEKRLAEIEADPSCLKPRWEDIQWERERQRYRCRERGCKSFREYAEAVKRRLARHGFTQPFNLDEDPKKQDKLTTWIEYLNYEYWWLDKYTSDIERLAPDEDKAWQKLVDMKILRPHETKENVRAIETAMQHEAEKERARKAVQRAESEAKRIYVMTQEDPQRLSIPKAKRISMLRAGTTKLLAAKTRLEQAENRSHQVTMFIRETFDYDAATRHAACHRMLTQWVLEQIPLIEAETAQSQAQKAHPDQVKGTKRRLATDEEPPMKRSFKKPKVDHRESDLPTRSSARVSPKAREMPPEPRIVTDPKAAQGPQPKNSAARRSRQSVGEPPHRRRRSARIAARMALESKLSPTNSRSRPRVKPAKQPPRVHPPAGGTVSAATG